MNGASTNVGTQPSGIGTVQPSFGHFTTLLTDGDINPSYQVPPGAGAYPTTWTKKTFTISGLSAPTTGRVGFLYVLTNNSVQGSLIGIDTFSLTTVAEPSQMLLLALGGLGLFAFRLRVQRSN